MSCGATIRRLRRPTRFKISSPGSASAWSRPGQWSASHRPRDPCARLSTRDRSRTGRRKPDSGSCSPRPERRLLAKGRRCSTGRSTLWRGPALADFVYEPFAQAAIAELESFGWPPSKSGSTPTWRSANTPRSWRNCGIDRRPSAAGASGGAADAGPVLLRPSSRGARGIHYTRRRLVEELGIEPGRGLQQLEGSILRQDASLDQKAALFEVISEPPRSAAKELPRSLGSPRSERPSRSCSSMSQHRPALGEHQTPKPLASTSCGLSARRPTCSPDTEEASRRCRRRPGRCVRHSDRSRG